MKRDVYIEIAGKNYPMRFSLGATKAIEKKYGSLEKMQAKINTEEEAVDAIVFLMELLIKQGCAYKNIFEKNEPIPEDAPAIDGKYEALNTEELLVSMEVSKMGIYKDRIYETILKGGKKEIEAKSEKNAETTQE